MKNDEFQIILKKDKPIHNVPILWNVEVRSYTVIQWDLYNYVKMYMKTVRPYEMCVI